MPSACEILPRVSHVGVFSPASKRATAGCFMPSLLANAAWEITCSAR